MLSFGLPVLVMPTKSLIDRRYAALRGIMQSKKENRNNNETKDACYSKEETDETDTIFKSKECEERRNIIRPHKNDSSFGCNICKRTFCDARSKKRHNMTVHCEERTFTCTICDKAFKDSGVLARHRRIHSDEKAYPCRFCDKTFRDSSTKRRHENLHTKEMSYDCRICGKAFNDRSTRKRHESTHAETTTLTPERANTGLTVLAEHMEC